MTVVPLVLFVKRYPQCTLRVVIFGNVFTDSRVLSTVYLGTCGCDIPLVPVETSSEDLEQVYTISIISAIIVV